MEFSKEEKKSFFSFLLSLFLVDENISIKMNLERLETIRDFAKWYHVWFLRLLLTFLKFLKVSFDRWTIVEDYPQ